MKWYIFISQSATETKDYQLKTSKTICIMKIFYPVIFILCMAIVTQTNAQQTAPNAAASVTKVKKNTAKSAAKTKLSLTAGVGMASYFGDLTENNKLFSQPGLSFSAGLSYPLFPKFNGRFDIGYQKIGAKDSENSDTRLKNRNLSFNSNVVDMSVSLEYFLIDLNKHKFSPYVSAGVGVLFFNPYANSASGQKTYLRELGTEGQGLTGFASMYDKTAIQAPVSFGLKYAASSRVMVQLEFNYRITGTDYLDDVSLNYYPDKTLLDARNPVTASFTYRGSEVGAGPYPAKNNKLSRGNPSNKDGFYTTQFKIGYKL